MTPAASLYSILEQIIINNPTIRARLGLTAALPSDHSDQAPVRPSPTAGAPITRRGGGSPRTRPVATEVVR